MKYAINRKTFAGMSDGVAKGAGAAMKAARKVEFRTPWVYHRTPGILGPKPWLVGLLFLSSAAAFLGGLLYFRKRKQVADRYTMGESDRTESWSPYARDESMAPQSR